MILSNACRDANHSQCFGYTQVVLGEDSRTYHVAVDVRDSDTEPCQCPCHAKRNFDLEVDGVPVTVLSTYDILSPEAFAQIRDALTQATRRVLAGEAQYGEPIPLSTLRQPYLWPSSEMESIPVPQTANEYQRQAVRTAADMPDVGERLKFGAMGMGAESGEVLNLVYKTAYQGHPWTEEQRRKLIEEVGDVLWFCSYTLASVDCDLMEAMQANNRKLRKRYGEKFSTAKSIARRDVVE